MCYDRVDWGQVRVKSCVWILEYDWEEAESGSVMPGGFQRGKPCSARGTPALRNAAA